MSKGPSEFALDFEIPLRDLENQIKELQETSSVSNEIDLSQEIKVLQRKVNSLIKNTYGQLTPWERVQLARHPNRPHARDYLELLIKDFHEVHGDRRFSDDASIITGFGYVGRQRIALVAIEKGRKTKEKIHHNFGMPNPEGYRKAIRVMKLASQFQIPVVTIVDTPGAYPGIGAEERGQACAIADNLAEMFDIRTPMVSAIIGEGGSGGALGIAVTDRVLMMEYSIYSVISPESCASILWADPKKAEIAANSLKLGPQKALELGIIDGIIPEPPAGAHRNLEKAAKNLKRYIERELRKIMIKDIDTLMEERFQKYRKMGNITLQKVSDE